MAKFRKKPVVIEAEQFLPEQDIWPEGVMNKPNAICGCTLLGGDGKNPHVHTAHNRQAVVVVSGDWIIPETDGRGYYPCKPDIFEATYESVENGSGTMTVAE